MRRGLAILCLAGGALAQGQDTLKERPVSPPGSVQVEPGTHILLSMINSVSTKQAVAGDRLYLETAFPILVNGKVIIPPGSWVMGTVTDVKRPGRMKGKGEMQVRFDSLTLPNGTSRDFKADLGSLDARNNETLHRENSKIISPGDKKTDAENVIRATAQGAAIGTGIGAASGHLGGGSLIGLAGGAAAGLIGVMVTRGPDATLPKGSTVEMVLDRPLIYTVSDLDFSHAPPRAMMSGDQPLPKPPSRSLQPISPF